MLASHTPTLCARPRRAHAMRSSLTPARALTSPCARLCTCHAHVHARTTSCVRAPLAHARTPHTSCARHAHPVLSHAQAVHTASPCACPRRARALVVRACHAMRTHPLCARALLVHVRATCTSPPCAHRRPALAPHGAASRPNRRLCLACTVTKRPQTSPNSSCVVGRAETRLGLPTRVVVSCVVA